MVFTLSSYDILKILETKCSGIGYEVIQESSVVKRILTHPA